MSSLKIRDLIIGQGIPKIAVSITGKTEKEILDIIRKIDKTKIDLVEWRVDFFEDLLDIKRVLEVLRLIRKQLIDKAIIFTFRREKEDVERRISTDYYINLNKTIAELGMVDLIDLEVFSIYEEIKDLIEIIHEKGIFVIGSNHDFLKTPSEDEMIEKLRSIEETGVDILKLAVMANSSADVLRLLNVTNKMKVQAKKPIVAISMGKLGIISRISGQIFGSSITFGALDSLSAPGQISVDELYKVLKLLS